MKRSTQVVVRVLLAMASVMLLATFASPNFAEAQSSSLFRREAMQVAGAAGPNGAANGAPQGGPPGPLMLPNVSLTYQQLPVPREIRVHDLITIRVDEKSQAYAEGSVQRRKTQSFDALLQDFVQLDGLRWVKPSPMSDGEPRIRGQANSIYRAQSDLETRESLKFDITAEVVDIRPNGNLVLEAHRMLQNNEETWEYSLTGLCRKDDVLDGNLVLSKSIAELQLQKRERGAVIDGYKRGWLLRIWDEWRMF